MNEPLSPAAQAVLDAADSTFGQAGTTCQGIAAALRAAYEQIAVPDKPNATLWEMGFYSGNSSAREALHVIADELEKA